MPRPPSRPGRSFATRRHPAELTQAELHQRSSAEVLPFPNYRRQREGDGSGALHRRSMLLVQARSLSGLGYYFDATYSARVAEAPGGRGEHYGGEVARRLGLGQTSGSRAGFATLLSGRDPVTSQPLDPGRERVRHAFFDIVFTSPKSVSLLYALAEPPVRAAVLLAHEHARDATLEYLERHAAWVQVPGEDRRSERDCYGNGVAFAHVESL